MRGPWLGDHPLTTTWRYSNGGAHFAWDVAMPRGTDLYAVGAGVVVDCQDGQPDPAPRRYSGMPSNWVILKVTCPSGPLKGRTVHVYYQHLTKNGVTVTKGQKVGVGQKIGDSGSSGNSSGPHLHLVVLKPGHTMTRSTRYTYLSKPEMVLWPPSQAWGGTTYPLRPTGPVVDLKNLRALTPNPDVRTLQKALNLPPDGIYGPTLDAAVRADQRRRGWTPDPVGKSSVGPMQARALGLTPR